MVFSKADLVLESLAREFSEAEGKRLWLAEEQQVPDFLLKVLNQPDAMYMSNRFDQVQRVSENHGNAVFNDFDFSILKFRPEHIFLRIPKQRALVHWLINNAAEQLAEGGALWLAGAKGEGIKTHVARAAARLGSKAQKIKSPVSGVSQFIINRSQLGDRLDDSSYAQLRKIDFSDGPSFWSKPGIYGWDKIDQGSQLLANWMKELFPNLAGQAVLDLGCGYGYLAHQAALLEPVRLVATDNCAAAVIAAKKNLAGLCQDTTVVAADCASGIALGFDLILCNPPFHRGFVSSREPLHRNFLSAIKRLLNTKGRAMIVVNSFLRLDRAIAQAGLRTVERRSTDSGFDLYMLDGD